jgi:putative polyhydroxyalkanoic acid system protein
MPFSGRRGAYASVARMSEMRLEVPTGKSIDEVREALNSALQREFPGGMLQRRWEGDVLHLSGPGAKGTVVLEDGRLIGRAELAGPASLMRGMIEQKVGAALRAVAG